MLWEELNAKDFKEAVQKSGGLCVIPIGVIEKHGDHLPLGTDMYAATAIAKKAAEKTSIVVFPYYFYGQIAEARHVNGCLAPSHRLIMDSLLEMCDEIHRNGFTKILLLSSHGGNNSFLPFFAQQFPGLNRSYAVYTRFAHAMSDEEHKSIQSRAGFENLGEHAGFSETSLMMYLRPDLVHMENVNADEWVTLDRLKPVKDEKIFTGFNWYSDYPYHFAGDPSAATPEHGAFIFDIAVGNAVSAINAIKADDVSLKLIEEYNRAGN